MPLVSGVRTARKLIFGFAIGLTFIGACSVVGLIYLTQLNSIVRHLAFDPVPGAAAIARITKDFGQYRILDASSSTAGGSRETLLGRKAADIKRDLKAYEDTITQGDDRRQFAELVALWTGYTNVHDAAAADQAADEIGARLDSMIEWNRLEGVRSIGTADSASRAVTATVVLMFGTALLLSALALYFNRTVERPMNELAETARAVALGNLDVRAKVTGPLEVATVARELNDMLDALARADAEAHRLHVALDESRDQLQHLAAGLLHSREEERTKIAREVHDILGQSLTALKMDVAWIGRRLPDDTPAVVVKLAAMNGVIDETVDTVRRIASDLRPGVLDDLGLGAAVEWQTHEFERRTGILCALSTCLDDEILDPLLATALFRIVQESLTNVARHSQASQVWVTLEYRGDDLALEVRDNGIGIAPADAANIRSIGLTGMRERALLVGGTFSISGTPDAGTILRVQARRRDAAVSKADA